VRKSITRMPNRIAPTGKESQRLSMTMRNLAMIQKQTATPTTWTRRPRQSHPRMRS
jgi:hypothetical protein